MSDLTCRLCLGQYEPNENISQLPCGHCFHTECLGHVESVEALMYYRFFGTTMGYTGPEYPKPCPCCRAQFSADDLTDVNYSEINPQNNMQLVLSSAQNTSDATLTVFNPTLERSMQQMTLTRNGIGPVSNDLETSSSIIASDIPTELILRRTRESISARRGKGTTGHKPKTEVIRKGPATTGGKKKTEVIRKGPATTGGKKKTEVNG